MVAEISSTLHFRTFVTGHKYLVADFFATWCPPCKAVAPLYEQLAKDNAIPGKIGFVKLNVDEQRELAAQYNISSIPTFLIFQDGKQIEEIKGANAPALKKSVEKIAADVKGAAAKEEVQQKTEAKVEEKKTDEQTVSGSYGMTKNSSWKMALN